MEGSRPTFLRRPMFLNQINTLRELRQLNNATVKLLGLHNYDFLFGFVMVLYFSSVM